MALRLQVERPQDVLETGAKHGKCYVIMKNQFGHRCGYICVSESHPWYGKTGSELDAEVDVHGGVTWTDRGTRGSWWIGFDCEHWGDASDPELFSEDTSEAVRDAFLRTSKYGTIRTQDYVREECFSLIRQAIEAVPRHAAETQRRLDEQRNLEETALLLAAETLASRKRKLQQQPPKREITFDDE